MLRTALTGLLAAATILLLSVTLVEYNQITTSGSRTVTSVSTYTATVTNSSIATITLNFTTQQVEVVKIQVFSTSGSQTTSTVTVGPYCEGSDGACVFHNSGSLDISGLGYYGYLLASVAGPNPFVFRNVTFTPIPDKGTYTGPAYGCTIFNATVSGGQTYSMSYCRFIGSGTEYVSFAPQDTKQVGMMILPDNTVYVLVKEGG